MHLYGFSRRQIVLRTNRLIRVRNVRCFPARIFWVFRFPGLPSVSRGVFCGSKGVS